ncbi:MAG: tetratricopeptide repeat protein [Candidatus Marinimicrobia bacterium]|jgi:tetratricopeptide (TPR) repeat protein|nr:tetratricopeptide repeat protein [Candidatus Neomarinimicrobiota bacterium]
MKYIKIILFTFCLTLVFEPVDAQDSKETSKKSPSVKSKKEKKLRKRRKKTPRIILKKFSRDSLKIEQGYKKELLKIKRSRLQGLRDAKKGYTPEVKAEIERDNNILEALVRDSGRLIKILKSNIRSLESGLSFLGEGQKVQKAEIYDQIAQYEFDIQLLDTTGKIITRGIALDSTLTKKVMKSRAMTLELFDKHNEVYTETVYNKKIEILDNKFRERMRKTEEKVNFILRDVHKRELGRIGEMKDRYEEQIAPLEAEAQILQDSLDILAIQALTGDKTLDSLYLRRKEVENENVSIGKNLNDLKKGIGGATFNFVMLLLQQAEEALETNDMSTAEEKCLTAISLAPEYPNSHVRLGSIYFVMGDSEKAKDAWVQALALQPDNKELKKFMFVHGLF